VTGAVFWKEEMRDLRRFPSHIPGFHAASNELHRADFFFPFLDVQFITLLGCCAFRRIF